MTEIDELRLMAYVDGELDAATRAEVEAALQAEPALQRRVAALRTSGDLLTRALAGATQGAQPPLRAFAQQSRRPGLWSLLSRWFGSPQVLHWQPMAATALVLLLTGGGAGYWLSSEQQLRGFRQAGVLTPLESQTLQRVTNQALETRLSGDSLDWYDTETGRRGVITPVRTFKTAQGRFCREFTDQRLLEGGAQEQRGIACREPQGGWQVRVRYFL